MWLKHAQVYDIHQNKFNFTDIKVENNIISTLGDCPASASETINLKGAFLLPGFIDCHVHICLNTRDPNPNNPQRDLLPGTIALWAAEAAKRMLHCGITSAREVGGWDYHEIAVREAIEDGLISGSRLFCAGRILTQTSSSTPFYKGMYEECDGPDEVRKAARKQLAMGADLIKVLATGALTSTKYERGDAIQLRPDEIQAAVEIASDNFTHVAAHAHATEGIRNATMCGCRSVEHGTYGNEEVYALMKEHNTFLVPTICVSSAIFSDPKIAENMPKHIYDRYTSLKEMRIANISLAHKMGVKIAMGTDVGTPGNHAGDNMQEPIMMVKNCGMSPAECIYASTMNPASLLNRQDDMGSIEEGKIADLIAVPESPLENIDTLNEVFFVMKDGTVERNDWQSN